MNIRIIFVILFSVVFLSSVYADAIYLKNGDRLTGKIESLAGGKLTIKTDFAGTLTVDIANVQTFSSDEPIAMHLNDGTVVNRKVFRSGQDTVAVGELGAAAKEFNVADINAINQLVKAEPKWEGDLTAGIAASRGNTDRTNFAAAFNLRKRTENDRTTISSSYAKSKEKDPDTGDDETTQDWWKINGVYDYFFTKKFFTFANGSHETDRIADLDRREIVGGGLGYQWVESKDMNFATRGGLASVYEKYDDPTRSSNELSGQFGYDFNKKLRDNVKLLHNLTYYPALEQFSNYLVTSTAEVRTDITKRTFISFKALFDYDATPADGATSTDIKYIAGVGAAF